MVKCTNNKCITEVWKKWKRTKRSDLLQELLDYYQPRVEYQIKTFSSTAVPSYLVEAEAKKNLIKAFNSYDPLKGTELTTHVLNYMQKTNRFIYTYQNVAKIPEHRVIKISTYQKAYNDLKYKLGREPSALELAEDLGWDIKEVERMRRELQGGMSGHYDIANESYDFVEDALSYYIYYSLPPDLKPLYEYLTGYGGAPRLSVAEIKRKLHLTDYAFKKKKKELLDILKKNHAMELV